MSAVKKVEDVTQDAAQQAAERAEALKTPGMKFERSQHDPCMYSREVEGGGRVTMPMYSRARTARAPSSPLIPAPGAMTRVQESA